MPYARDPVSELFDQPAAALLRRAYRAAPEWTGTRIAPPTAQHIGWAISRGILLAGYDRDQPRWVRAMIRSVYYLDKWHYWEGPGLVMGRRRMAPNRAHAIRYEVGRRFGTAEFNAGWAFRIRVLPPGAAAVERRAAAGQNYTEDEDFRSSPEDRDWE